MWDMSNNWTNIFNSGHRAKIFGKFLFSASYLKRFGFKNYTRPQHYCNIKRNYLMNVYIDHTIKFKDRFTIKLLFLCFSPFIFVH